MTYSGIYTALITPFRTTGELDSDGLRVLVKRQVDAGVHGLVALGTTGENPTLSAAEKKEVISIVRDAAAEITLMVGCGAYSTTQTVENIQVAADLGADAALVVTPFYNKPTQEGVFRHFEVLSQTSPIPIMVYNHPGRTGVLIETSTLARIAELPGIIGVKETSGKLSQFSDIIYTIKQKRPDFSVMSGDDDLAFPVMAIGGDGVICGASNLFPETLVKLAEACQRGDFDKAREIHLGLTPLFKSLVVESNPIPLKAMHTLMGLPAGHPRLPLTPLDPRFFPLLDETLMFVSPLCLAH